MKNFKLFSTLLLCVSTVLAQDDMPKTLPELIDYANQNLSSFCKKRTRFDDDFVMPNIIDRLELVLECKTDSVFRDTYIRLAKQRIKSQKDSLHRLLEKACEFKAEALTEAENCSSQAINEAKVLFEKAILETTLKQNAKPTVESDREAFGSELEPYKKCLDSLLRSMQATAADIVILKNDIKACNKIAEAFDQLK